MLSGFESLGGSQLEPPSKRIIEKPLKRFASGVFFSEREATVPTDSGNRRNSRSSTLSPRILPVLLLGLVQAAGAETYVIDLAHSSVGFSIRHLVSRTTGHFNEFSGTISYDPASPGTSAFSGVIEAESIDTGNERRDNHLRSADFFEVGKYPRIEFASTSVKKGKDDFLEVTGTLSLHGVTRTVNFPVEVLGVGVHPMKGKAVAGFAAEFAVKRSDYGVDNWIDAAGVLGDEVKITVLIEALGGE